MRSWPSAHIKSRIRLSELSMVACNRSGKFLDEVKNLQNGIENGKNSIIKFVRFFVTVAAILHISGLSEAALPAHPTHGNC